MNKQIDTSCKCIPKRFQPGWIHRYSEHLKNRYEKRVQKIGVDIGQRCPHRGKEKREKGGCYYCNPESFIPITAIKNLSVTEQVREGKKKVLLRYGDCSLIIYFQSFTSSLEDVEKLRVHFNDALKVDGVIGLAISGRPDSFSAAFLSLLKEFSAKTNILLEIGLESSHDDSLHFLGRQHSYNTFTHCIEKVNALDAPQISTCVHLITNIPNESLNMLEETAIKMASLEGVHGVKLHHFHVVTDTPFETAYKEGQIAVPTAEDVINALAVFLPRLRPDQLIHRLIGDCTLRYLVAPLLPHKPQFLGMIDTELKKRSLFQSKFFSA